MLVMEDEKGIDDKIFLVLSNDLRFEGYKLLTDVSEYQLREIQEFFTSTNGLNPASGQKSNAGKTLKKPRKP
jgi:inorganic pyrophosphatase